MSSTSGVAVHTKPCLICRRRRVKCDRLRPCSNCTRSEQLCSYDAVERGHDNSIVSNAGANNPGTEDLRERLAKLEEMMAAMLTQNSSPTGEMNVRDGTSDDIIKLHENRSSATVTRSDVDTNNAKGLAGQAGQLVFQDGYSACFDPEFWAVMTTEVDDLRILLNPAAPIEDPSSWLSLAVLGLPQVHLVDLSTAHPTLAQSNDLCRLFCENINCKTQLVHNGYFHRSVTHWRRGSEPLPQEFEAFMFTTYLLTANSLAPEVVEKTFATNKSLLVANFHHAVQASLSKLDFLVSDKVWVLVALVQYTTFLFRRNVHHGAIAMLGITVRVAQNQGHHRDPAHYPLSKWVGEIRRRIWNQICCLDALAITNFGAESCLPATADCMPPINANDEEWKASRFASPSSLPGGSSGYTDMTYTLVEREISDLTRKLTKIGSQEIELEKNEIQQVERKLNELYFLDVDRTLPAQTVIVAMAEVRLSTLKLGIKYREAISSKTGPSNIQDHEVFLAAVESLEAIDYHIRTFSSNGWDWIFLDNVPWLAIAIVLVQIPQATIRGLDVVRAQRQIEIVFYRYEDPDRSLSHCRLWKILVDLRRQEHSFLVSGNTPDADYVPENPVSTAATIINENFMMDYTTPLDQSDLFIYDETLDLPEMNELSW
ncbi:hypothetical protein BP5796_02740 [Coleophoma crateriformis]|uniref:Zn(2)-C6 fungal-type domain-containing protein n=1 Tax=Coleophoma crateriformis TaxID=565419 RepID=A0A3D8SZ40_9HELO|nr:hypothetical protein BP5796_02740 [Coleophoma crateriformis]